MFFCDITKKEGYISLVVISVGMICFLCLVIFTDTNDISFFGTLFFLLFSLVLIVPNRKKLHTLGFTKEKLKISYIALISSFLFSIFLNAELIYTNKAVV